MWPCGTLETCDLKAGQLLRWEATNRKSSSLWILVEELPLKVVTYNRKFTIWCLGTTRAHGGSVGTTTTYEFNANNVGRYTLVSDVGEK